MALSESWSDKPAKRVLSRSQRNRLRNVAALGAIILAIYLVVLLFEYTTMEDPPQQPQQHVLTPLQAPVTTPLRKNHSPTHAVAGTNHDPQPTLEEFLAIHSSVVGVICRFYEGSIPDVVTLTANLLSQERLSEAIVLLLVPTEPVSREHLASLQQQLWAMTKSGFTRVQLLPTLYSPPEELYMELRHATEELCTEDFREEYLNKWGTEEHLHRYCGINSYLHYKLTDLAYQHLDEQCVKCRYLLFTNADNLYAPDFLSSSISTMRKKGTEVLVSSFVHRKEPIAATQVQIAELDLGGVVLDRSVVEAAELTFFKAVTNYGPLNPQTLHDADFWFVKRLEDLGARVDFLQSFGFMHN